MPNIHKKFNLNYLIIFFLIVLGVIFGIDLMQLNPFLKNTSEPNKGTATLLPEIHPEIIKPEISAEKHASNVTNVPVKKQTEKTPKKPSNPSDYAIKDQIYSFWTDSDEFVSDLFELKQNTSLTSKQINKKIKETLGNLEILGIDAIPYISAYLETEDDIFFDQVMVKDRIIDEQSLRTSLFNLLGEINSDEAIDVLILELTNNTNAFEIASLAKVLNQQLPGELDEMILKTAHDAYQTISKQESIDQDLAPLFHVISRFGNESSLTLLQQITEGNQSSWNIYAAMALSQLPDGKGISSLTKSKLLDNPNDNLYEVPLRALAQVSAEYPEAQKALVNQARSGNIPDRLWPKVASALSGNGYFQIEKPQVDNLQSDMKFNPFSHQIFGHQPSEKLYLVNPSNQGFSEEQIDARISVIDDLLEQNENKLAVNSLLKAKEFLLQRIR